MIPRQVRDLLEIQQSSYVLRKRIKEGVREAGEREIGKLTPEVPWAGCLGPLPPASRSAPESGTAGRVWSRSQLAILAFHPTPPLVLRAISWQQRLVVCPKPKDRPQHSGHLPDTQVTSSHIPDLGS